ncbi:Rv2175c family DNA-binding protein [Paramicrobacterium sp. CJ85]|uniref:Rv2175c family DNA-binding protein n=1 Tax=Paramicrobacterium sp. CJ85 TaxID=3445355 RepID=UPI003F622D1A
MLDISVSRVRRLIEDRELLAVRREGIRVVPASFIRDGAPVKEVRGTLFVLLDAGFSDDEAIEWMLAPNDAIGETPIAALRAGRKSEVRRVAQALA